MHKYNKLRLTSINLLRLSIPIIFSLSASLAVKANSSVPQQKTTNILSSQPSFSGKGIIGDLNTYTFEVSENQAVLVDVTRLNTEFKLTLTDSTKQESIYSVSFPTQDWLSERILVTHEDCTKCQVIIEPLEQGDRSGSYQLSANKLKVDSNGQQIQFESLMTQASVLWFKANQSGKDLAPVFAIYQQAIESAKALNSLDALQRSRYLAAQAAHYNDDYDTLEKIAAQVANQASDDQYQLRATYLLGMFSYEENLLESANEFLGKAHRLARQLNNQHFLAASDNLLGLIAAKQGHLEEASRRFESSYQNFVLLGDWRQAVDGLINRGWSQYRQGKYPLALNNYRQALSLSKASNLGDRTIDATYKIGEVYARSGDTNQANLYLDSALTLADAQDKPVWRGRVLQVKAKLLYDAGTFLLSKVLFEDALKAYAAIDDKVGEINCRYYLARIHNSLGDFDKAYQYFAEVLKFDQQVDNQPNLGQSYFRLAEVAFKQQNYQQALKDIGQAINILEQVDDEHIKGQLYSLAGSIYFYNQQKEKAFAFIQKADSIQSKIEDHRGKIETGYRLAEMYAAQEEPSKALAQLSSVMKKIELLRSKIGRVDLKQSYLALHQKVAALQIELLIQQPSGAMASLAIAESFRSQTLAENLLKLKANTDIPTELANERTELQQKLQSTVADYLQLSEPRARQNILNNTRRLAAKLQQLEARIDLSTDKTIAKEIAQDRSVSEIQSQLADDSIILYFDTNPNQSYLWLLTSQSVDSYTRTSANDIAQQVEQALKFINNRPSANKNKRRTQQDKIFKQLSDTLFSKSNIDWNKYRQLIIVGDGPLNYLPFSMLTLPGSKRPILHQQKVTYIPSLNVYAQLKQDFQSNKNTERLQSNRLLLLANPSFAGIIQPQNQIAQKRSGFEMSELPYSQKEAHTIAKITPTATTLLSQQNASKQDFYQHSPEKYQMIHFATHGLANSELPSLGGLVLSNVASSDNLLLAPEISNLSLNAELVVLSGCETALGRLIDGEGLQGLSRSFFEAGAKRVVASLWAVQDDATAELMSAFYRGLLIDKLSPAESLRIAKLHVRNFKRKNNSRPWRDPYYWAGFVLQGIGESWIE